MRVAVEGVERCATDFSFSYNGEAVTACAGESIAAALLSAGELTCRLTRAGEPRGVFCGMGVCGECTVIVDGVPRRACMEMAAPDMTVESQPALRVLEPESAAELPALAPAVTRAVDVLVIGAGPAGLAAARSAAQHGAAVLLVDERAKAGGQYFKQPGAGFVVDDARVDAQFQEGRALYQGALDAGVEFCFGATVWGAFAGPQLGVSTATARLLINARRVVVSPGAYERPLPFPGWTLPGVMTTGAAQTLLRAYQTAPGKRVLVAGNGPLNLQVARELSRAGVAVLAVAELSRAPGPGQAMDLAKMCLSSPDLVAAGAAHLFALARAGVPVLHQRRVIAAQGEDRLAGVTIARIDAAGQPVPGSEENFAVDALCLGYGFLGQSEIARALGAEHQLDRASGMLQVQRDESGRSTSAPEVFVAGDAGGLGGARVAIAQGALAGSAAARDLGCLPGEGAKELRSLQRALRRHRRFQRSLWSVYAAPLAPLATATADTIVCRCESVSLGRLETLLDEGLTSIGAIKRETRAGMGRCQGRYCAGLLATIVNGEAASAVEEQAFFAPRPPFKPLSIAALATRYDQGVVFNRSAGAEPSTAPEPVDAAARESHSP